jgi:hypothetical protein
MEAIRMDGFAVVAELELRDTGGGFQVDLVVLKDGRALGISEDAVVLYASLSDFEENGLKDRPMIPL